MPTYEYRCKACGHELEAVQAFSDDPLTECPECGGDLRKLFGSVGISFKGSGFYKNDSRSSSTTGKSTSDTSSGAGSESGAGSDSSSSSTSDSKSSSGDSSTGSGGSGGDSPSTKQPASA